MKDRRADDFISAHELARLLNTGKEVILIETHNSITGDVDHEAYLSGHIPGAYFADIASVFSDTTAVGKGSCPLPGIEELQAAARQWGIHPSSHVVVYDRSRRSLSSRGWWTLKWAGLQAVSVLDGGLGSWIAIGEKLESGATEKRGGGTVVLSSGNLPVASIREVLDRSKDVALIDARGRSNYIEGHIPGAVSGPFAGNLDDVGAMIPAQKLRGRFAALGVSNEPVIVYCGGGVAATHNILALKQIGIEASLYPGSWSEWTLDPSRPVAVSDKP